MKYFFAILVIAVSFSCKKKKVEKQAETDEAIIVQYISDNNLTATATGTGLYYTIDVVGSGASPNVNSDVIVAYQGYYTDGTIFDESLQTGIEFNLQGVIQGWTEGIPYFRVGGSGKLLIPSALAYGTQGSGSVPPNSVLIFNIDLIEVL
ncbi:MAG: FKBP-type peptidyl-prolyl cis-trans isomerase [Fluviicola sp.]|nr:FKBP-type peptidyl-prolyl cis-trans isomerase [Fluviicola sp.]